MVLVSLKKIVHVWKTKPHMRTDVRTRTKQKKKKKKETERESYTDLAKKRNNAIVTFLLSCPQSILFMKEMILVST